MNIVFKVMAHLELDSCLFHIKYLEERWAEVKAQNFAFQKIQSGYIYYSTYSSPKKSKQ